MLSTQKERKERKYVHKIRKIQEEGGFSRGILVCTKKKGGGCFPRKKKKKKYIHKIEKTKRKADFPWGDFIHGVVH